MIFRAIRELREAGVLGMNGRNAGFILASNARSRYPTADDKVLTKRLALEYQIPTPPLYHVVEHHGDIVGFEERLHEQTEFVLKPARGSGGNGIVLIKDRTKAGFVKQSGEVIPLAEFAYHISGILSGIYSLGGQEDKAIFEALIYPDPVFAAVTHVGVPDIRIIVYRGVPVMGMVRLPTKDSDGKANLHQGAIGAGVEMESGTTLTAVYRTRVITHHPDTGNQVSGIQVPHWGKMLLMAARAFDMTGLGYLGIDMIIDKDRGPLLLELNARPGLAIQLANRAGLRERLERVEKAPPEVLDKPEARVSWALEAFRTKEV
jgi:alpha-L-glutamate ligase-like protein